MGLASIFGKKKKDDAPEVQTPEDIFGTSDNSLNSDDITNVPEDEKSNTDEQFINIAAMEQNQLEELDKASTKKSENPVNIEPKVKIDNQSTTNPLQNTDNGISNDDFLDNPDIALDDELDLNNTQNNIQQPLTMEQPPVIQQQSSMEQSTINVVEQPITNNKDKSIASNNVINNEPTVDNIQTHNDIEDINNTLNELKNNLDDNNTDPLFNEGIEDSIPNTNEDASILDVANNNIDVQQNVNIASKNNDNTVLVDNNNSKTANNLDLNNPEELDLNLEDNITQNDDDFLKNDLELHDLNTATQEDQPLDLNIDLENTNSDLEQMQENTINPITTDDKTNQVPEQQVKNTEPELENNQNQTTIDTNTTIPDVPDTSAELNLDDNLDDGLDLGLDLVMDNKNSNETQEIIDESVEVQPHLSKEVNKKDATTENKTAATPEINIKNSGQEEQKNMNIEPTKPDNSSSLKTAEDKKLEDTPQKEVAVTKKVAIETTEEKQILNNNDKNITTPSENITTPSENITTEHNNANTDNISTENTKEPSNNNNTSTVINDSQIQEEKNKTTEDKILDDNTTTEITKDIIPNENIIPEKNINTEETVNTISDITNNVANTELQTESVELSEKPIETNITNIAQEPEIEKAEDNLDNLNSDIEDKSIALEEENEDIEKENKDEDVDGENRQDETPENTDIPEININELEAINDDFLSEIQAEKAKEEEEKKKQIKLETGEDEKEEEVELKPLEVEENLSDIISLCADNIEEYLKNNGKAICDIKEKENEEDKQKEKEEIEGHSTNISFNILDDFHINKELWDELKLSDELFTKVESRVKLEIKSFFIYNLIPILKDIIK